MQNWGLQGAVLRLHFKSHEVIMGWGEEMNKCAARGGYGDVPCCCDSCT